MVIIGQAAVFVYMVRNYLINLRSEANSIARELGITDGKEIDAFRHSYASAKMTFKYGEKIAKLAGDLNEALNPNNTPDEERKDKWNNAIGRDIGNQVSSIDEIKERVYDSLENGDLMTDPKTDDRSTGESSDLLGVLQEFFIFTLNDATDSDVYDSTAKDEDVSDFITNFFDNFSISDSLSRLFNGARRLFTSGADPLTLDLDGDGIETVGIKKSHQLSAIS